MTTPTNHGPDNHEQTGGTSEETHLTVKRLAADWIVENAVGTSVASADDRESAIELARQSAADQKASSIAVLADDGTVERTIRV